MGNFLSTTKMGDFVPTRDCITPVPTEVLPDPTGPSNFQVSRNGFLSSNFNVFNGAGSIEDPPLWLFLHTKGKTNGSDTSFVVLENFWRAPFSDEGEVLCWCQLPAFQKNGAYRSVSRWEEHPDRESGTVRVHQEWEFSIKIGFYRDRYMEESLGVLHVWSIGRAVCDEPEDPLLKFFQHSKDLKEVRYVFRDKSGRFFPIKMHTNTKVMTSAFFSCSLKAHWNRLSLSTRPGFEASLALLVGYVCANVLSPQRILASLDISELKVKCS